MASQSAQAVPMQWILILATIIMTAMSCPVEKDIVTRYEWGARPPTEPPTKIEAAVPYVIIHHSYIPKACCSRTECAEAMRWMQDFHQIDRGWDDIGYSFAIGGDGSIYEGRGFNVVGAHAIQYNGKSVGICLIGDWSFELPPVPMLKAVHHLIGLGVKNGNVEKNYTLIGHRQVGSTECPGDRLFKEISKWPHFSLID